MNHVKLDTLDALVDALNDAIGQMKAAQPDAGQRYRDPFYAACANMDIFVFGVLQRRAMEMQGEKVAG